MLFITEKRQWGLLDWRGITHGNLDPAARLDALLRLPIRRLFPRAPEVCRRRRSNLQPWQWGQHRRKSPRPILDRTKVQLARFQQWQLVDLDKLVEVGDKQIGKTYLRKPLHHLRQLVFIDGMQDCQPLAFLLIGNRSYREGGVSSISRPSHIPCAAVNSLKIHACGPYPENRYC